jgi:glycosyltransferase involved in cell wall biosynthesis
MKDTPLISVITVVLNEKQKLQRSIDSIVQGGFSPLQFIIIDGGSSDGTLDVVKANGDVIDFWVSEPDRGISHAFNKGIAAARGELVGIVSAGDWHEPDALYTVVSALIAHPDIDVFCGAIRLWERGEAQLVCRSNPQVLERETSVYHPTVFIRKSAYQKFGLYDESYRLAMDYELLLRFKRQGAKFLALDETLANMTLDGVSSRHWYAGLKEVRRARRNYFPAHDVLYHHLRAVAMNLAARALKRVGLRSIYQAYWNSRNSRLAVDRQRED